MKGFLYNPWIYLLITGTCLYLCTYLPVRIKNDAMRKWVSWLVLVPVSLVIIMYVYPVGIEFFKKLAVYGG